MKKVLYTLSAALLALLAVSCDKYEKAVFKASDATPPVIKSIAAGKTIKITYDPAVIEMSFNEKMNVYHTIGLVAIGKAGESGEVEYTTVNQTLSGVKDDATNHVVSVASDNVTNALLARGYNYGDALKLKLVVRASIQDPAKGVTNGYVDSKEVEEIDFKLKKPSGGAYAAFTEVSPWSVIGSIASTGNSWNADSEMATDGTWHVCEGLELTTADEFKFRKDADWGTNFGGEFVMLDSEFAVEQNGPNIKVLEDGLYDLLLNPDAAVAKIVVHKEDPYAKYNQESPWSVIGSIASTGNSWNADEEMASDGTWHLCRGLELTTSDEFKFRKDAAWGTNFGGEFVALGEEFSVTQDGPNIKVLEDGTYDLYLNPEAAVAKIMKAGEVAEDKPQVKGITIDGDDSDWEGLEGVVTLTCAEGAALADLLSAKILCSDKLYLLVEISDAAVADGKVRLHMYFNGDNDVEGGLKQHWDKWDIDYMTEGKITNGGAYVSYSSPLYPWAGTQADPWAWDSNNTISITCEGAGAGNKYELSMDYSTYPGGLSESFDFGIDIVNSGWETIGYLPNVAEGECSKVTLTLPAAE